jgi:hypothetical protein
MKPRKTLLLFLLGVLVLLIPAANAGNSWYTCTVLEAGPAGGKDAVHIKLTDNGGAFSGKWFRARTGREKEMLALALAAMSNAKDVRVYTDSSDAGKPEIYNMYLQQ